MKPAPFEYVAPRTLAEAVGLLDEGSRVLAGGQSLVPLLNLRHLRPQRLVDINGIHSLAVLRRTQGHLRIGATVRQATLERSALVTHHWPLLAQAVRHVGHLATRSRGTVCGSVAHADPRAELPAALAALDAHFELSSGRILTADELTLEPHELLVAITVPPQRGRSAFAEFARTHGDFATAGVAVVLAPKDARVALLGPRRATMAERALNQGAGANEAAALAAGLETDPHRRALVTALTLEALNQAGRA
jgi:aerobic carbon-monoxide dehydrogenase medium subunit